MCRIACHVIGVSAYRRSSSSQKVASRYAARHPASYDGTDFRWTRGASGPDHRPTSQAPRKRGLLR